SLDRTYKVMGHLEKIALETPGIAHTLSNTGRSFVLNAVGSNLGSMFMKLDPFDERRGPGLSADEIAAKLRARIQQDVLEAKVAVFGAPAVDGLGNAGGLKVMLEAIGDVNYPQLQGQADNLAEKGNQIPGIMGMAGGLTARVAPLLWDGD